MNKNVFSSVMAGLQNHLSPKIPIELISESADLQNDLGFDSLGLATMVTDLHVELEFDLQYFAENIGDIRTVSDLMRVLEEALLTNV